MSSIFQYASRPQEPAPTEAAMPVQQAPQVAPPQASGEAPKDNASIFQASQKLPEPPKEESFGHKVVRHTARTAARAGEAIVGLPGDIASGALRAGNWLAEKLKMNPMDAEEMSKILDKLPTSQNIRSLHERVTGDYLKPQGKAEEISDEFVQDLSTLLIPVKGKIPFVRAFGTAVAGNLAKEGAAAIGGSEGTQQATKLGAMVLTSLINPKSANKYKDMLYSEADNLVHKNATVSARNIGSEARSLIRDLKKGGSAASKTPTMTKAEEILKRIKGGRIEVKELTEFKKTINEARGSLYKDINLDKAGRKAGLANLNRASKIVDNGLKEYGKANPAWEKLYRSANEAHGAIVESQKASNWIKRQIPHLKYPGTVGLIAETILAPGKAAATVAGGAATIGGVKAYELSHRILNSPVLRKHYMNVWKAGLEENAKAFAHNAQKLDSEVKKDKELAAILRELEIE
jgi:hypothetical protein